jgi:hypothetical protein
MNRSPTPTCSSSRSATYGAAAHLALTTFGTQSARDQLNEALAEFDQALPDATSVRNVLEHFDDYTRGIGDLQQSGARAKRVANEELARTYVPGFHFAGESAASKRPILTVGPHTIDLRAAAQAADRLVHEIWAAGKTDEGNLVSRAALHRFLNDPKLP